MLEVVIVWMGEQQFLSFLETGLGLYLVVVAVLMVIGMGARCARQ
jgi:hypothetical protein